MNDNIVITKIENMLLHMAYFQKYHKFIVRKMDGKLYTTADLENEGFEVLSNKNKNQISMELPPVMFPFIKAGERERIENLLVNTEENAMDNEYYRLMKYTNPKYSIIHRTADGTPCKAFEIAVEDNGLIVLSILDRQHRYNFCYIDYSNTVVDVPKIGWITPSCEVSYVYPDIEMDKYTYKNVKMGFYAHYKEDPNTIMMAYNARNDRGGMILSATLGDDSITIRAHVGLNISIKLATIQYNDGIIAWFKDNDNKKGYSIKRWEMPILDEVMKGVKTLCKNTGYDADISDLLSPEQMLTIEGIAMTGIQWLTRGADDRIYGHFEAPYYSNIMQEYVSSDDIVVISNDDDGDNDMFPELVSDVQYPVEELLSNLQYAITEDNIDNATRSRYNMLGINMCGINYVTNSNVGYRLKPNIKSSSIEKDIVTMNMVRFEPNDILKQYIGENNDIDGVVKIAAE